MKKILFLLAAIGAVTIGAMLSTVDVKAQCNGVFPNNTICGNLSGAPAPPQAIPLSASAGTVNWLNVKSTPCTAKGDGVTDDTAAINACIATFNTTGNGVLYFPAGTYLTSSTLTTITANGIITGDGITSMAGQLGNSTSTVPKYTGVAPLPATVIQSSSTSVQLFTVNSQALLFTNLTLQNTASVAPTSGAGIVATSTNVSQKVDYQNIEVSKFFINIDVQTGNGWSMSNVFLVDPVLYQVKVRNIVDPDYGDWAITNFMGWALNRSPTDCIRIESSGGGKITNFKCDAGPSGTTTSTYVNGIDLAGAGNTVDMFISNGSIETFSGAGVKVTQWPNTVVSGVEMGFGAPTNLISATNTTGLYVSGIVLPTASSAPSGTPISLTNCSSCYISNLVGVTNPYSGGTIADHDGTGGQGGIYTTYSAAGGAGLTTSVPNALAFNNVNALTLLAPNAAVAGNNTSFNIGVNSGMGNWMTQAFNFQGNNSASNGFNYQFSFAAQPDLTMLLNGHVAFPGGGGSTPTLVGGCGGTSSVVAGTDVTANVTGQNTNVTSCILQFGTAFSSTPVCIASGITSPLLNNITATTTSLTVHFTGTTSYQWSYHCHGT